MTMNKKRVSNGNIYAERNSKEAMYSRNKTIVAALNELMKDVTLVKHRRTLDDVSKALTRVFESDQKLPEKCRELQKELSANQKKLKDFIQMSEEDKKEISTLKSDLQTAWNVIEQLKLQNDEDFKKECIGNGDENSRETDEKADEDDETLSKLSKEKYKLLNEIEKGKLQVFELEEELANKEKALEELSNNLNSKSMQLEDVMKENLKLKSTLDEMKATDSKTQENKMKATDSKTQENKLKSNKVPLISNDSKLNMIISSLKKKLLDTNKRDQISLLKVKHLIKKNKGLSYQLQITIKQNNLMKLQLSEQTRMLDLMSGQYCKLEEKDKKQAITIKELENIRNQYVHMIGNLEQEILEMKKQK